MRRGLYAVVDVDACATRSLEPRAVAEGALEGGATMIQLRAKHLAIPAFLALAEGLARIAKMYDASFYVNDRVDVALAVGAGVHVGQGDLPARAIRRVSATVPFGVSTHDRAELDEAALAGPSYVAFGPVFPTASKENPEPVVGLASLREMAAIVSPRALPLVAIGGITIDRAPQVFAAGASFVAVIAGILPAAGEVSDARSTISAVAARSRAYDRAARLP